jgi:hypothetical protein
LKAQGTPLGRAVAIKSGLKEIARVLITVRSRAVMNLKNFPNVIELWNSWHDDRRVGANGSAPIAMSSGVVDVCTIENRHDSFVRVR